MANPFDQFDEKTQAGNPFDQFDAPKPPTKVASTELSIGEKLVSMLPKGAQEWLSNPSFAGIDLGKGSAVHGAMLGAADPVVGAAQLATLGQNSAINKAIDEKNADYEDARAGQGRDGFDAARMVGNVAAPANIVIGAAAPVNAATKIGKVLQGARAGAIGGATAPVVGADDSFVGEKIAQTGAGGVMGGVLTPVASAVGEKIARRSTLNDPVQVAAQVDDAMRSGLNKLRAEGVELDLSRINALRQQVAESMQNGEKLDVAAMVRKADFDALGIEPTRGQITRDPLQFSREKNLQGVSGIGEPLNTRFNAQDAKIQSLITGRAEGAADDYTAGQRIISALKGRDEEARSSVTGLYRSARESAGKDLEIPLQGLAQDYAETLSAFGDKIPSGVRNQFKALGLESGTQQKLFTFEEADKLLKVINANATNDPAVNTALGQLRNAVKKAQTDVDATGGPFAPAVAAAKKRFEMHDAAPALKAAVNGDIHAQDFTRRFLINGKADEVASLAKAMPDDAFQEARRQFGAAIERAAFGENVTGDAAFSAARFSKFLNQPGMRQKLSAFYSPEEVGQLDTIARVGAYKNSLPSNHAVNTSNTSQGFANLGMLSRIPGLPQSIGLAGAIKNMAGNQMAVNSSLRAEVPKAAADIAPKQLEFLSRVLGGGMGGVAGAAGTGIGN